MNNLVYVYMVNQYEHIGITCFSPIPKRWQECKNQVAYVSYWAKHIKLCDSW